VSIDRPSGHEPVVAEQSADGVMRGLDATAVGTGTQKLAVQW